MIKNGIMFSIQECEVLLELIQMNTIEGYKKLTHQQLSMITELRSLVRDNPMDTHIEQYHD